MAKPHPIQVLSKIPDALHAVLFNSHVPGTKTPVRYRVAYSGRGAGKSWSFARAMLLRGMVSKERCLCVREIQRTISESVHQLLKDQIESMNMGEFYRVYENKIVGANGTEITFAGLSSMTETSMKSYEGVTICWVEEGQSIRESSWRILAPTVRRENSEIWITMNPGMDTDPTWVRYVKEENRRPDSIVVKVSYGDNRWFSQSLEAERQHDFETLPDSAYRNIWEGEVLTAREGAIYAREVADIIGDGRLLNVPYDPRLKVHACWDFGWRDATTVVLVQKRSSEVRIIGYLEGQFRRLDWYLAFLKKMPVNWGIHFIPHDGEQHDFKHGTTARDMMTSFGFRVARPTKSGPGTFEQGIMSVRMLLPRCVFHSRQTVELEPGHGGYHGVPRLIECLKNYRYASGSGESLPTKPVRNEWTHGCDAMRVLAVRVEEMTNDDHVPVPRGRQRKFRVRNPVLGLLG